MDYIEIEEKLFRGCAKQQSGKSSKRMLKTRNKESTYKIESKTPAPYLWCDDIYDREMDSYAKHTKSRRHLVKNLNEIESELLWEQVLMY